MIYWVKNLYKVPRGLRNRIRESANSNGKKMYHDLSNIGLFLIIIILTSIDLKDFKISKTMQVLRLFFFFLCKRGN